MNSRSFTRNLLLFIYAVFFAGLLFNWRAIFSTSLLLLCLFAIIHYRLIDWKRLRIQLLASLSYLLIVAIDAISSGNYSDLQLKLALVAFPLGLGGSFPNDAVFRKIISGIYVILCVLASAYCLLLSGFSFYHELTRPLGQHAVYFSFFCFLALCLLGELRSSWPQYLNELLAIFLSACIVLLSSKLVIAFLLLFWLRRVIRGKRIKPGLAFPIGIIGIATLLIAATHNPVGDRYRDLFKGDPELVARNKFDPGIYFNGLQFRLLQWRLVPGILNESKAWLRGVGAGYAQPLLNSKYEKLDMYLGDDKKGDTGYRFFNCHNQILESLLRYGLPGLITFIFLAFSITWNRWREGGFYGKLLITLVLVYALLESVLETQYGIFIFSALPLLLSLISPANPASNSDD